MIQAAHFILYVADQRRSADFYRGVLDVDPILDVPGMTEYPLGEGSVLGLMPETGIKRLLGEALPDPASGNGIPRAELYLRVKDCRRPHHRAIEAGGIELSPVAFRDWGDFAGYILDPDGHVIAFAQPGTSL